LTFAISSSDELLYSPVAALKTQLGSFNPLRHSLSTSSTYSGIVHLLHCPPLRVPPSVFIPAISAIQ